MASGRKPKGKHPDKKLSPAFVHKTTKPGRYCDGNGLYLKVDPSGARRWEQRLVIQGRQRTLGLGGVQLVSLSEAREKALANRKIARAGGDPMDLRRQANIPTFEAAAAAVIELHRPSWRNAKHASQWETTLRTYVYPRLGKRPVSDIDTAEVLSVLMPIWHTKAVTARRVRQRISTVMKWAVAQGFRQDNPAGEAISAVLPRQNGIGKRHHPALPHGEVAGAIAAVCASGSGAAVKLAFEFLILTAGRSGEIRHMTWSEVDMDAAIWTVPAERTKAGREHRVPLCTRAMEILVEAGQFGGGSGLVFPGAQPGRPLSEVTLSKLMQSLSLNGVPHGFRSSFRDWAAECTNAPRAVMEAALAHTIPNKAEAAYARSDLFERRGKLMEQWAEYLANSPETKVIPMSRQRSQSDA